LREYFIFEKNTCVLKKTCRLCKKSFSGRIDKIFCSIACKNDYHVRLRRATAKATKSVDTILHRNRSILLELLGKRTKKLKTNRYELEKKNFHFNYITGYSINKKGKTYHHVYDFSFMTFSDETILIVRR